MLKSLARMVWPAATPASDRDRLLQQDPAVESLEDRCLLSGNVRVLVSARGDIRVLGDGGSNYVHISSNTAGQIVVEGLPDTQNQMTTINGSMQPFVIQGTSGDETGGRLQVLLRGGNDFAELDGILVTGEFRYQPSGGHDSLALYSSVLQGGSRMITGGGNDFIAVVDSTIHGTWDVRTAGGQDFVGLANSDYTGQARITTGGGLDGFYVADSNLTGNLNLNMGGWPDAVYLAGTVNFNGRFDGKLGGFWDMLGIEENVSFNGPVSVDFGPGGYWGNQIFTTPTHNVPTGFINVQDINRSSSVAEDFSDWITEDPQLNLFHLYIVAHVDRGFDPADLPIETFGTIDYSYIRSSYYYQFFAL